MAIFKKKGKVIDLTEHYRKNPINLPKEDVAVTPVPEVSAQPSESSESSGGGFFGGFFGGGNTSSSSSFQTYGSSDETVSTTDSEEKKRRLAKRLGDITTKIEELSNQIYHLQQRLEVVERKLDVNRF